MSNKGQLFCAWAGLICPLMMFAGLMTAGFFPPQSPLMTPDAVATFYAEHGTEVRVGMILLQFAGACSGAFIAGISAQLRRIEHPDAPAMTYAQMALGATVVIFFVLPGMLWIAASFRPERALELTSVLHDLAWLTFVGVWALSFLQNVVIGLTILWDQQPQPIFSRWVGFFNLWMGLLFVPAALMPFFKAGPFAWNGLLVYWMPASAFGAWYFVMATLLLKLAKQQHRRSDAAQSGFGEQRLKALAKS